MRLDPAVAELLQLDPEQTTVSSAGGGGCSSASTLKITRKSPDGSELRFFMKTGKGEDAEVMFSGFELDLLVRILLMIRQVNMHPSTPSTMLCRRYVPSRMVTVDFLHSHQLFFS